MQAAFREHHGLQCGFCTPGMIMSAVDIVNRKGAQPRRADDPRRARRQSLPLHGLPQHRQGDRGGRPGDGRSAGPRRPPSKRRRRAAAAPTGRAARASSKQATSLRASFAVFRALRPGRRAARAQGRNVMTATGIGAPVRRKEDQRFVTGQGRYVDDFNRPGQAYAYFLRSPHAHADDPLDRHERRQGDAGRASPSSPATISPPTRSAGSSAAG